MYLINHNLQINHNLHVLNATTQNQFKQTKQNTNFILLLLIYYFDLDFFLILLQQPTRSF